MTVPALRLIEVSRVHGHGETAVHALRAVSLEVAPGELVAVMGPSGSGKSTLLGLMAGLDAPSAGSIELDGTDITRLDEDQLTRLRGRELGFVFQFFNLVPSLTALENVALPLEIAGQGGAEARARALLHEVGLDGRLAHYPSQLSGGEQQRVALARALVHEPGLLLADEPTGNLDAENGRLVFELLLAAVRRRGTTLVLVTHDEALTAQADLVVRLRGGRLEALDRRG